ncbi:MAG: 3'-5' exonuclease [Chromatiales bacterium]|jgi:DNA polymerase-3 subunit epsilon|nr:3'-5' exonuclease [Chromatiales bacterium]MDX9766828.1 3'-5' exonuclease [Ectothiorhodospiraceae bacterium]
MSFLASLFRPAPVLEDAIEERVSHWHTLPTPSAHTPLDRARFVVIDVETTGLDMHSDELLSVGLVPAGPRSVEIDGLAEIVLRHERARVDKDNLVIHGITPTESASGTEVAEALVSVLEHIGKSWLVAFHADFDRVMLTRAFKRHLGLKLKNPFLDLAWLLPALYPDQAGLRSLDEWLGHFGIAAPARHRASGDALVTAELLLIALSEARRQGRTDLRGLAGLADTQARLDRMSAH